MKKLLVLLVLCSVILIAGCTMTESADERFNRVERIRDLHAKMMQEDSDKFWMIDHNSKLTVWHPYVGNY